MMSKAEVLRCKQRWEDQAREYANGTLADRDRNHRRYNQLLDWIFALDFILELTYRDGYELSSRRIPWQEPTGEGTTPQADHGTKS